MHLSNRRDLRRFGLLPGIQHHLNALLLFVAECAIGLGSFIQAQAMSDDECWVDISALNPFQQRLGIAVHVRLAHLEDQTFSKARAEWDFVEHAAIDPGKRYYSPFAAGLDCLPQNGWAVKGKFHP